MILALASIQRFTPPPPPTSHPRPDPQHNKRCESRRRHRHAPDRSRRSKQEKAQEMSLGARVVKAVSSAARSAGQALDSMGASMEVAKHTERLVPSTRIVAVDGVAPAVSTAAAFIAPSASVIGDVTLGPNSSVWYGATLRGDVNPITVGPGSSIGDRAVVHVAKINGDLPTKIGSHVTVEAGATVHAATLLDRVIVGAGATVLDGATVGPDSVVEAGSVIPPGRAVPSGEIWGGNPAKLVRKLTKDEIEAIAEGAIQTAGLATLHAEENAKDYHALATDEEDYEDRMERHEDYFDRDREDGEDVLGQGAPGRIFNTPLTNPEEGLRVKTEEAEEKKEK